MERTITPEELRKIEALEDLPDHTLQWIIDHAKARLFQPEETLFKKDDPADYMYFILEGFMEVYGTQNDKMVKWADFRGWQITGLLPYSRMKTAGGTAFVREPSMVLMIHRDQFPEMEVAQPALVQRMVNQMTDRVREQERFRRQREKMMALGKLSAGLAHELNNPAAAMVRSSSELRKRHASTPDKFKKVLNSKLTSDQVDAVNEKLNEILQSDLKCNLSLSAKSSLEDDMIDWMEDNGVENADELAETFVETGFGMEDLEYLQEAAGAENLSSVVSWIDNVVNTERIVQEIEEAAKRISDLINNIKTYSHMDRDPVREFIDIRPGLESTLSILNHKIKTRKIKVVKEIADDIPEITAIASELNQIWTNIIANAVDAMDEGGTLTIRAWKDREYLRIEFEDNGSGIPEDHLMRIFEPFFTTKDVGQGTGLGLDIVKKIVDGHRGDVKVTSEPGKTVFHFCFPING